MNNKKISVIVDSEKQTTEYKSARPPIETILKKGVFKTVDFETSALKKSISCCLASILEVLSDLPTKHKGVTMESISFSLSVSCSGKISLVSALSAEGSTNTGLTFTFSIPKATIDEEKNKPTCS